MTAPTAAVNQRLLRVTNRLARTTSALRVRADDATRADANGGTVEELLSRMEAAVTELEKATAKLTKDL